MQSQCVLRCRAHYLDNLGVWLLLCCQSAGHSAKVCIALTPMLPACCSVTTSWTQAMIWPALQASSLLPGLQQQQQQHRQQQQQQRQQRDPPLLSKVCDGTT